MNKLFATLTNDTSLRSICSSGGFITTCANKFIENGGIVYAAAFVEKFHIEHIRVDNVTDLKKTAGSKYSVSSLKQILPLIKADLLEGKKVLFIGTPCQCAIMKKKYDNKSLYLIDLICHGNTSPKYYEAYLSYIEEKFGSIQKFNFRDKTAYGLSAISSIVLASGRKKVCYSPKYNYYYYYMKQDAYLSSCYSCQYANIDRIGDITVGDFWGIEIIDPKFPSSDGVSAVIINSYKGDMLWKFTKDSVTYVKEDLEKYIPYNAALTHAVTRGEKYDIVRKYLKENRAVNIFTEVYDITIKEKIAGILKKIVPKIIYKEIIKYKRRKGVL